LHKCVAAKLNVLQSYKFYYYGKRRESPLKIIATISIKQGKAPEKVAGLQTITVEFALELTNAHSQLQRLFTINLATGAKNRTPEELGMRLTDFVWYPQSTIYTCIRYVEINQVI